MSTIFEIVIRAQLLKNNSKLSLIIAQTPAPTLAEIAERRTNAKVRTFLRDIFAGGE